MPENALANRCQGLTRSGPCRHIVEPGKVFCPACENTPANIRRRTTALKLTNIEDQQRSTELNAFNQVYLMRDAMNIAAVLLEEAYNNRIVGQPNPQTVEQANKLTARIQSLGRDLSELEIQANETYTRDALNGFGQRAITVIQDVLQKANFDGWEKVLQEISFALLELANTLQNPKSSK